LERALLGTLKGLSEEPTLREEKVRKMEMKVFMTGATGYVGGAVAEALKKRGYQVIALVQTEENAKKLQVLGYRPVLGDMRFPASWQAEATMADVLIHAAQVRLGRRLGAQWVRTAKEADTAAFHGLTEAAKRSRKCKALIYTSGVSVHGDHGESWVDEDTPPTPGTIGKYHLAGEQLVAEAYQQGLPAFALRPGLPYGVSGNFKQFFLDEAASGKFKYAGNGHNFFPTVSMGDLAEAYALAVENPPVGKVINIVDDEPLRMREIGTTLLAEFEGGTPSGVPRWLMAFLAGRPLAELLVESHRVKNAKAKEILGWQPRYPTFRDGIKEVVIEYKHSFSKKKS
jgi:nucleoside-diphosphate-sugar epimerase